MIDLKTRFPQGESFESEYFNGAVSLQFLVSKESKLSCPICNVTFAPGCRNHWHRHPGGQILLVTDGRGWYQEEGQAAQELLPGSVVEIPRYVKHWHGAAKDSAFAHVAIETNPREGAVEWLEPVSEKDYQILK